MGSVNRKQKSHNVVVSARLLSNIMLYDCNYRINILSALLSAGTYLNLYIECRKLRCCYFICLSFQTFKQFCSGLFKFRNSLIHCSQGFVNTNNRSLSSSSVFIKECTCLIFFMTNYFKNCVCYSFEGAKLNPTNSLYIFCYFKITDSLF